MLRAGFATAVITPALPVHLAGYGDRRGAATGVHDDLQVCAVVLDDGATTCCLLTFDVLVMSRDVSHPIRTETASLLGCDPAAVITSTTHVHAAPSALTGTDAIGWPVPDGFPALLRARAVDAVGRARSNLTPVAVRFARGDLPGDVAVNRRGHPLTPGAAVLVLDPVVTIANFGIHPTVTGPSNVSIATDYVGPFRRGVGARTGRPALFLQGCQGDVNPVPEWWESGDPARWAPVVDAYAARLVDAVVPLVDGAVALDGGLRVHEPRTIDVPIGDTLLAHLAGRSPTRTIELLHWSLGDVAVVAVPGEGFHAVERRLRRTYGERVLLAGLAPEWHGYLPVPYGDGYEEGLSLGPVAVGQVVAALSTQG
jgi:hypothetical protein